MVLQIILQGYPYFGGGITNVLNTWAALGVFAYVLPFLIIFAVVYAILSSTQILGNNRGVQATIALAVGLMALVNDYVTDFFSIIFPYTGIGISILLVALIIFGLMGGAVARRIWLPIGVLVFVVILLASFSSYSWFGYGPWGLAYSWPAIIAGLIILGLMAWIVANPGKGESMQYLKGHPRGEA